MIDRQGLRSTVALNPMTLKLISLLEKPNLELEEKMQKGLKLARFLKNQLVWAVLSIFAIMNRDANTTEICLGNLESVDKSQFILQINNQEDEVVSQALFYQLINKGKEAENLLIKERKFYETVKMFVKNFEFRKALKVAKKVKEKRQDQNWLVDYVVLQRKRFIEEIGAEKETDSLFKDMNSKRTLEEIKQIR